MNKLWSCLLILMFHSACIVLPTAPKVIEGRRGESMDLSFLCKGQTKKDVVFEKLGFPTTWLQSQRSAVYGAKISTKSLYFALGSPLGGGIAGAAPIAQREALFITFDESERIVDWGVAKVPLTETWLSGALAWARSKGLTLPEPAKEFRETIPPQNNCLIYVYCPQRPSLLSADLFPSVTLDGLMYGQVRKRSFLKIETHPGPHIIYIYPDTKVGTPSSPSYSILTATINKTLQPGDVVFLELRIDGGLLSVKALLSERPVSDAIAMLKTLRETW